MGISKVLIGLGIIALILAAIGGGVYKVGTNKSGNVVNVYPVEILNSDDMYEYGSELTGVITSDFVQVVVPDGTREIKKIYVEVGDKVKVGDKLLKYNVEEQELDLQLQKLQIESSKIQIEKMEKELEKLKKTKTVKGAGGDRSPVLLSSLSLSSMEKAAAGTLLADNGENQQPVQEPSVQEIVDTGTNNTGEGGNQATDPAAAPPAGDGTNIVLEDANNQPAEGGNSDPAAGNAEGGNETADTNNGGDKDAKAEEQKEDPKVTAAEILAQKDLNDAKKTAVETIENRLNTYTNPDKDILRGVDISKAKQIGLDYTEKINSYTGTETNDIISYLTDALSQLDDLVALSNARKAADQEINAYTATKKYGKEDEAKKLALDEEYLNLTTGKIYTAQGDDKGSTLVAINNMKTEALAKYQQLDGGPLYHFIDDPEMQRSANSGDGTKAETPIRYLLVKNADGTEPTVAGTVVNQFFTDPNYVGKYIEFRVYNSEADYPEGTPGTVFTLTPTSELNGVINFDKNYTVEEIKKLTEQEPTPVPEYLLKSVTSYTQYQDGHGTSSSKYKYYLRLNAPITGSVIKDLIKKKKYAIFADYLSDDSFAAGADPRNTIVITPSSQFSSAISSDKKYTIEQLNKLLVTVDSVKVYPQTKNLKYVYTGGSYQFNATIKGKNLSGIKVKWTIKGAKSNDTRIGTGGLLVVSTKEKGSAIKVTATTCGKSGSYLVKVKKGNGHSEGGNGSGSGEQQTYTKEELKEAIAEKEQEIAEAKQELNEARITYQEQKKEIEAATVRATIKGKVTVADINAPIDSPVVEVRGDSGVYLRTAVSELDFETVKVGGTINVTSNETGEVYEATVKEVSEYPVEGAGTEFGGNPNSSYYPIVAYIEDGEELKPGQRVTINYDSASMGTGTGTSIYLPMAYVRTEGKQAYVYKADENGLLVRQNVKTGKVIQGQVIEIISGLTMDDAVAFPYGKNLKEGMKTKVTEDQDEIIY